MMKIYETELSEPVVKYFLQKGFEIRSEVKDCDIIAIKEDVMVIIELKLRFNLKLLYQAIDRQRITDYVYICIPRPKTKGRYRSYSKSWKQMIALLKKLEIGLITVALDSPLKIVDVIINPMPPSTPRKSKKRKLSIIREIEGRKDDFNIAGTAKKKISTAYREKSIKIACILASNEKLSTLQLREYGLLSKDLRILSDNFYGWFDRISRGVYTLSESGANFINSPNNEFADITGYYKLQYVKQQST